MSVAIRPLAAADRAAWSPLWDGYTEFYGVDLAPEVTDETWRRLLDPDVDVHGFCAIDGGGALVGFVHYLFHPVTWSITPRCYLEDLYVAPDIRGGGIGARLIKAVYAAADVRQADQVYWYTDETNAAARRLYDRIGQLTPFIRYRR